MHRMFIGTAPPAFQFSRIVLRAYAKWEEDKFPADAVRAGLSADAMLKIFNLGMTSTDLHTIRDFALILFAFLINGLQESSVLLLQYYKV